MEPILYDKVVALHIKNIYECANNLMVFNDHVQSILYESYKVQTKKNCNFSLMLIYSYAKHDCIVVSVLFSNLQHPINNDHKSNINQMK